MNKLAKISARNALKLPGVISRTRWQLPDGLTFDQWVDLGRSLTEIEGSVQWWLGDWWAYGSNREWGDGEQIAEQVGVEYSTIRDYGTVARAFDLSSRNDKLTYSHHRFAMAAPPAERAAWIDRAAENGWSANRLKVEIVSAAKTARRSAIPDNLPLINHRYRLIHADLGAADIEPASIDCIVTDPPYPAEYLGLFATLAKRAAMWLKPGGSMLVMSGQTWLPQVLTNLAAEGINYHWTLAYLTPGGQAVQIFPRKVNTFWKPVFWLVKGEYSGNWVGDVARSDVNDNDKRFHDWGQSESGMADLIDRVSLPGQTILDPFCGGGTTGVVALKMNRLFVGIDSDESAIATTSQRLHEIANAELVA